MRVWQMPTIAVLMHFVITPTDPSIARVHQDIQEMDENAQVVFISRNYVVLWQQKLHCLL